MTYKLEIDAPAGKNLVQIKAGPYTLYVKHTQDFGELPETYATCSYTLNGKDLYDAFGTFRRPWQIEELIDFDPVYDCLHELILNIEEDIPPSIFEQLLSMIETYEGYKETDMANAYSQAPHVRNRCSR